MGSITNLKENKTTYIPCECKSEILVIEYDHDLEIADLAIYNYYGLYKREPSLVNRIRYCIKILLNRKIYADQIILSKKQLLDLASFLKTLDLK